jgi:predicted ferric reductase
LEEKKNKPSRLGYVFILLVLALFTAVTVIMLLIPPLDLYLFTVRLLGIWGYLFMAIAAIMTPYLKQVTKNLGRPFLKVHHSFAYTGIVLIVAHPVLQAVYLRDHSIFLPDFSSWIMFWGLAGRPALIILFIALIGVLLRKKIRPWRILHVLMYVMLLMGLVHGILIGTDFANRAILVIFYILFAFVTFSFVLKRIQKYKSFKRSQRSG